MSNLLYRSTSKIIWGTLWGVLAPGLLFLSLGLNIYQSIHTSPYKPEEPVWANVLGIICMVSIFLLIFGTMAWLMLTTKGSFRERGRILRKPSQNWGPAKSQHRYMWETLRREDERKKTTHVIWIYQICRSATIGELSSQMYSALLPETTECTRKNGFYLTI